MKIGEDKFKIYSKFFQNTDFILKNEKKIEYNFS